MSMTFGLLGVIPKHRHDQPPHHPAPARNQIQVPVGDRVKGSRVDSDKAGLQN